MERYFAANYAMVFAWGLAVLLGMIGWGRLVAKAVGGEAAAKAGWGLHAAWGASVYLFLAGSLAVFHLGGAGGITLVIGGGLAAMIWTTYRAGLPTREALARIPWSTWPAYAVIALMYAGSVCWQGNVNWCDDLGCYYSFCEKLLATGSFDDPLSWRRLASLGGHTVLECSVLARASYANFQTFELGICPIILLGLILGFREGALARTPLGLLLAIVAVTTPLIRMNTTSHFTAVILFVGLFVTLDLIERTPAQRQRLFAAAGLIAAALCTMRAQNVAAAGLALGIFWLASWIKDRSLPRVALTDAVWWGGTLFVALLPWMIMGLRSNGSPLFPLFPGGNNLAFDPQGSNGPLFNRVAFPMQMLVHVALLPLLVCLFATPEWRRATAARATGIAAVITSLLLAYGLSLAPDEATIPRYVQPLLLAGALAALMTAAISPRRRVAAWALTIFLLTINLPERCHELWNHYAALSHPQKILMPYPPRTIADYRDAQSLIPEGKRVLVCSDFPFLFDHERNPIWNIDLPNGTSPAPHLPFQKPPEDMKRYLHGLGIEYLIFVDFDRSTSLYSRAIWTKHSTGDVELWKIQSAFFLDFINTTERLAMSESKLGKVGDLTVLQFKP